MKHRSLKFISLIVFLLTFFSISYVSFGIESGTIKYYRSLQWEGNGFKFLTEIDSDKFYNISDEYPFDGYPYHYRGFSVVDFRDRLTYNFFHFNTEAEMWVRYVYDKQMNLYQRVVETIHNNGHKESTTEYFNKGILRNRTYTDLFQFSYNFLYDYNNKLIGIENYQDIPGNTTMAPKKIGRSQYYYDIQGNLAKVEHFDYRNENKLAIEEHLNSLSGKDSLTQEDIRNKDTSLQRPIDDALKNYYPYNLLEQVRAPKNPEREIPKKIELHYYDASGIKVRSEAYDFSKRLDEAINYKFDTQGKLLAKTAYNEFNEKIVEKTFTYDENGKIYKKEIVYGGQPDVLHRVFFLDRKNFQDGVKLHQVFKGPDLNNPWYYYFE